jgi:hypothetical protein
MTRALTRAVAAEASSASEASQPPSRNPSPAPSLQLDNLVDPSPEDSASVEFIFPASAVATHTIPGSFSSLSPDRQASLKSAVSALQTALATPPNSTSLSAIAAVVTLIEASDEDYAEARAQITASMRSSSATTLRLASISDPTTSLFATHFPSSEHSPHADSPPATSRFSPDLDPAATPIVSRFHHHSPARTPTPEPQDLPLRTSFHSSVIGPRVIPAVTPAPSPDLAPVSPTHAPIFVPTPVSPAWTPALVHTVPGPTPVPPSQARPLPIPPHVSSTHP